MNYLFLNRSTIENRRISNKIKTKKDTRLIRFPSNNVSLRQVSPRSTKRFERLALGRSKEGSDWTGQPRKMHDTAGET